MGQFQLFRNISSLNSEAIFESCFLSGDTTVGVQTHDSHNTPQFVHSLACFTFVNTVRKCLGQATNEQSNNLQIHLISNQDHLQSILHFLFQPTKPGSFSHVQDVFQTCCANKTSLCMPKQVLPQTRTKCRFYCAKHHQTKSTMLSNRNF